MLRCDARCEQAIVLQNHCYIRQQILYRERFLSYVLDYNRMFHVCWAIVPQKKNSRATALYIISLQSFSLSTLAQISTFLFPSAEITDIYIYIRDFRWRKQNSAFLWQRYFMYTVFYIYKYIYVVKECKKQIPLWTLTCVKLTFKLQMQNWDLYENKVGIYVAQKMYCIMALLSHPRHVTLSWPMKLPFSISRLSHIVISRSNGSNSSVCLKVRTM